MKHTSKRPFWGAIVFIAIIIYGKEVSGLLVKVDIADLEPTCPSEVYCDGRLLDTVQMASIYNDSKTFVDMKMRFSPNITIEKFNDMMSLHNDTPSKEEIRNFVEEFFEKPGSEFEDWVPDDWRENPQFLSNIKDADYRQWASDLHAFWLKLGRNMTKDVAENPDLYSIIHVEHPVIVPGGRFREFYYWDSYWIVRGLLYSEMYSTVKGMLENFFSIVDRFGFIPNGGRIYYSKRSQPPLLAGMVKSYIEFTNDEAFASQAVEYLEREFNFWLNNHAVEVQGHTLMVYGDKSRGPRPESYREDIITSQEFVTDEEKEEHFSELKAAAESGMDFSSRWFIKDGTNEGTLVDLKTRYIVPVELNAILFWNAKIIAELYVKLGNLQKSAEFESKAQEIFNAVQTVLWHDDIGSWLDYDMINQKRRNYFVPTNLSPLWMKCYNEANAKNITEKVLQYIESTGIDKYLGGVPNTLASTGEQWDFPNVWPPMQYLLIMGLDGLGDSRTKELAEKWADRWVTSNFVAWNETHAMFEKYSAEEVGGHGGGGEYDVQIGFGWTNGVILELLDKYGESLSSSAKGPAVSLKPFSCYLIAFVAVVATMTARILGF